MCEIKVKQNKSHINKKLLHTKTSISHFHQKLTVMETAMQIFTIVLRRFNLVLNFTFVSQLDK
jgi:hypothetical protein